MNTLFSEKGTAVYLVRFTGKELDPLSGLYDFGARYYDPRLSVWFGVDPLASKNSFESPYVYVHNNPLKYIDPDGRDGILVVFPNYKVDTETRLGKQPLGHAGVLLIDNKKGLTKYYEYGRYDTKDGTKGRVRTISMSNVKIGEDGKPTQESLNKVLEQISKKSGQGGKIEGAYVEGDFKTMNDYAQSKLKESNPQYNEYDKEREPYSLTGNNCATFSCDVLKQDPEAKKNAPWIFNPTPNNVAEEYQDNFPKVNYDPKTKTTTSDIYKKKDE
ncbi:MAG TPA: RHS repeat-associated core domain-containing protein [Saprospiraceae bacterium]|nr:RHS repeat-associated core domain-containing protein [Saprospiraceae bacterium]